jgi:hypothetical protein
MSKRRHLGFAKVSVAGEEITGTRAKKALLVQQHQENWVIDTA